MEILEKKRKVGQKKWRIKSCAILPVFAGFLMSGRQLPAVGQRRKFT